jgi:SAM-dependent methyltransferase
MFFNRYERKELLEQYIKTQYGPAQNPPYLKSEPFYQTIVDEVKEYIPGASVLDVGCALGRMVFEYEKLGAKRAVGIDTSKQFIRYANTRKTGEQVEFILGDIMKAPLPPRSFKFISCINVIDRVKNPPKLLETLHELLAFDGVLLLVDPYDWDLSPTLKEFRVDDMKTLINADKWQLIRERRNIEYTTPIAEGEKSYQAHLVLVKKLG